MKPKTKSTKPRPGSWANVAANLRCSRQALAEWRRRDGAPARPDVKAWQAYVAEAGLGIAGNRTSSSRELLLAANLSKRNRLLDFEFAVAQREMIPREEVNALLFRVASLQKGVLYAELERAYPGKVVGRTASEISAAGRALADRLCDIFQREMSQWQTPGAA